MKSPLNRPMKRRTGPALSTWPSPPAVIYVTGRLSTSDQTTASLTKTKELITMRGDVVVTQHDRNLRLNTEILSQSESG